MVAIILGAQSNVWTQLTLPNPPSGAVPFVFTDNTTIAADPSNFNYSSVTQNLTVTNGLLVTHGDTTAVPAAVITQNFIAGRFKVPAGVTTVTINCNLAAVGDIVNVNFETTDTTFTRAAAWVSAAGVIMVTGNGAATATPVLTFTIIKVR